MKELTSRQKQAIATKTKIRKAAYALLQDVSFEQLKMNDIASAAGVSVGTLYHHYASKEELLYSGYHEFDLMIEKLQDTLLFTSHIEAIRSVIYAETSGSRLRGINLMSTDLRIQFSSPGSIFINNEHPFPLIDNERHFPRYLFTHVKQALENRELISIDSAEEITNTILRSARGTIFDCCARNNIDQIAQIALHDLDIILSHYTPDHCIDFPPPNPAWLNAYKQWLKNEDH